jgi:hypothetical protein
MTDFQYDIAFSFTTQDENIATQIRPPAGPLSDVPVFEGTREAGRHGRGGYISAVFKEQARSVAVLLRPEWGNTPWTRIEQSAIRHRAYYHGYDFTTFIVTVPGTPIPDWLHPTRIWYDLKRFGVDGAAAVLAARIQERGGAAVEETLADRTARLERTQKFNCEKEAFANSEEGVNASRAAHQRLIARHQGQLRHAREGWLPHP